MEQKPRGALLRAPLQFSSVRCYYCNGDTICTGNFTMWCCIDKQTLFCVYFVMDSDEFEPRDGRLCKKYPGGEESENAVLKANLTKESLLLAVKQGYTMKRIP